MIAHKSHRANAVPQSPEARLEIVKAIHALATQDKDERLRQRRAELILIRRELRQIALALHELKCACDPRRRSYVIKYSPDQPRVPAGNPDGGQWTSRGESPAGDESVEGAPVRQTNVADAANNNLTPQQVCRQVYAEGMASVRMNPSLSPDEYLDARYELTSALEICLNLANGVRPIFSNGNFVEFLGAGVVVFRPGIAPFYVPFPGRQ